ncbi:hypothetical protein ABIA38_005691 [Embleya sp. AB8]
MKWVKYHGCSVRRNALSWLFQQTECSSVRQALIKHLHRAEVNGSDIPTDRG